MKKYLSTILAILLLAMGFVFFLMGKELVEVRDLYEMTVQVIETLQMENEELQNTLTKSEKDKENLKMQIESLTAEKTELEDKIKELSIQKTNILAEQKKEEPVKDNSVSSEPKGRSGAKTAYLTFDDGPSANTEQILDTLKTYGIKATFFVNGNASNKELYKRIIREGHVIGNHTYSHNYKSIYTTVEGFMEDFEKLNVFLEEVTGVRPTIARFPGGSNNQVSHKYGGEEIMKEIVRAVVDEGYQYFDWNVSSLDAEKVKQDKDIIVNAVLEGAKDKTQAVILMHDSAPKTTTAEGLPEIIEGLIQQGFIFKTLDEDSYAPHFLKIN